MAYKEKLLYFKIETSARSQYFIIHSSHSYFRTGKSCSLSCLHNPVFENWELGEMRLLPTWYSEFHVFQILNSVWHENWKASHAMFAKIIELCSQKAEDSLRSSSWRKPGLVKPETWMVPGIQASLTKMHTAQYSDQKYIWKAPKGNPWEAYSWPFGMRYFVLL